MSMELLTIEVARERLESYKACAERGCVTLEDWILRNLDVIAADQNERDRNDDLWFDTRRVEDGYYDF